MTEVCTVGAEERRKRAYERAHKVPQTSGRGGAAGPVQAVSGGMDYEEQLEEKLKYISESFQELVSLGLSTDLLKPPGLDVRKSPAQHFRMRTALSVDLRPEDRLDGSDGTSESSSGYSLYRLTWDAAAASFHIVANFAIETLAEPIAAALPALASLLSEERFAGLRRALTAVKFHATLSRTPQQLLTCLVYGPQVTAPDGVTLAQFREALQNSVFTVGDESSEAIVIAQGKGWQQCEPAGRDFVDEALVINHCTVRYRQPFGQFSNPNPYVAIATAEWLQGVLSAELCLSADKTPRCDLLELYCGAGSHTVALAPLFRYVLAVEINKHLVEAAQHNVAANRLSNVTVMRSPSQDFCGRLLRSGSWELKGTGDAPTLQLDFGCTVVDPPRAGLDAGTLAAVSGYGHVLYISCNPEALRKDMASLLSTHDVRSMVLLDHFPFTPHVEMGVYFRKRDTSS